MAKSIESLVSFSAGEWSPTLTSRVDQAKYRSACIQLRNMLGLKTGPATRRPGTQFEAQCKEIVGGNYCARMEDFQFSVNTTFALEWGHHYVRFYSNGAQVVLSSAPTWVVKTHYVPGSFVEDPTDGNNIYYTTFLVTGVHPAPSSDPANWVKQSILEVPTPYSALVGSGSVSDTEVFQLQFCPINDVIYVCHKDHPRAKLTRFSDTNWVYEVVVDRVPALLDQNATDTTIAASAATGTTQLSCSAPAWATGIYYDVGNSVLAAVQAQVSGVGGFVIGQTYTITVVGTTDFTLIGASANTVGISFIATGPGSGTGFASSIYECVTPHVSNNFEADLDLRLWSPVTVFQPLHVGAYWELSYLRASTYIEYTGVAATGFAAGTSATITAFGAWEVHTYGVWLADIAIQSSANGGITWETVRSVTGRADRNVDITGTAVKAQLYRIVVSNVSVPGTPGSTNPRIVFECVDSFLFGIVQITAVANAYHATANVITQLTVADAWVSGKSYSVGDRVGYAGVNYICLVAVSGSTIPPSDATHWGADGWPTIYWSEGAWSAVRGYPRAVTTFEQRVWYGFTEFEPQNIWGTVTGDTENFDLGDQTLATDGVAFALDAVGDGALLWLQAQDALFVGLVQSEWVVAAASSGAIAADNVTAHRQSRWGSAQNLPAIVVGDALVFAQRQAFSIRQMLFSVVTNKYMSQDLTALSEQILNGGALQLAYQRQGNKNGFVWATTANGELVGMTYELDQEIFGWHRHFTGLNIDAGFESVCVLQGKGTADDEVWVVVRRTVGGSTVRYVERLNPVNWQTIIPQTGQTPGYGADKNQAYHVDCGVTYHNPASNTFTGLGHLNGRTVAVAINGVDYGTFVVSGGQIIVDTFSPDLTSDIYAHVGLPFTSTVQPMNLDVDVHTGVTKGIMKKVSGIFVNLLNTLACTLTDGSFNFVVTPDQLIVGNVYTIISLGDTDFTALGATTNTVGLTFTATAQGTGTGTAGNGPRQNELVFRTPGDPFGEIPLFTGLYPVEDFPGSYDRTIPVIIHTDGPLPLTVCAAAVAYNVSGGP